VLICSPMTGKLLSDVYDVDDMNTDEVMMVSHSLSLTHMLAYYFTLSYSIVSHSLEHDVLLPMICHHCCRIVTAGYAGDRVIAVPPPLSWMCSTHTSARMRFI